MTQPFSICEGDTVLLRCSESNDYVFAVAIRYVDIQVLYKCNSKSNCKLVYTCCEKLVRGQNWTTIDQCFNQNMYIFHDSPIKLNILIFYHTCYFVVDDKVFRRTLHK